VGGGAPWGRLLDEYWVEEVLDCAELVVGVGGDRFGDLEERVA
jgi:hypothetical protein